jgi:dephospho-CoA kinase
MIIGLTGGIGSGKTAVSDIFASQGIDIVDADLASRVVVEKGKPALDKISEHFGAEILSENGELNRAKLREIIFKAPEERQWLESLLHPIIAEQIRYELDSSKSSYCILVSPLLLETEQKDFCDSLLIVDVPEKFQVQRTALRDNVPEEQVESIMATQIDRAKRLSLADKIIVNDGTLEDLKKKVMDRHLKYLSLIG